jgi:hypothetical protein
VVVAHDVGGVTITIGPGRTARALVPFFWWSIPVIFFAVVYQIDPTFAYVVAAMAAVFVLMMFGASRLVRRGAPEPRQVIRLTGERIAIDGVSGETQSLSRADVQQVRVDTYTSYATTTATRAGASGVVHPRLVVEGSDARLVLIGSQLDAAKLEWARDYLRYALAQR